MPVTQHNIQKGHRVESLNFGWMEAVSDAYPTSLQNGSMKIDVRFDDTGTVRKGVLERYFAGGYVRDGSVDASKSVGTQYNTFECGPVEIVDFKNTRDIKVKFLNTDNVQSVQFDALVTGIVADQELQKQKREEEILLRQEREAEKQRMASIRAEKEAAFKAEKDKKIEDRKAKLEADAAKYQAYLKKIEDGRLEKLNNLYKTLTISEKELNQERNLKGVLNVDFKDRDGNWVLRYKRGEEFVQTRLGKMHNNMTQRVKTGNKSSEHYRAYESVEISEMFLDPQKFCDWAVQQKGWGLGYQLDKDLLSEDSKIYSEYTCCFLPSEINLALIPLRKNCTFLGQDGLYGLEFNWCGYCTRVPGFKTEQDALDAYRKYREEYIKKLAVEYKDAISDRAFDALMNWKAIIPV